MNKDLPNKWTIWIYEKSNDWSKDNLKKIKFTFFLTIHLNSRRPLSTFGLERSFRFVKAASVNILNDFPGKNSYFIRPIFSEGLHYHVLLETCSPPKLKPKLRKVIPHKFTTQSICDQYFGLKNNIHLADLRYDHRFEGSSFDLKLIKQQQEGVKAYVVFNKHNPKRFEGVDIARFFSGDEVFCYATNIWNRI